MRANTVVATSGAEVYEHEIMELVDDYLSTLDNPERIYENNKGLFNGMMKYIYLNYFRGNIDTGDIQYLDDIWNIYTSLCYKYNKRPTLLNFSILTGIDNSTFNDWKIGTNRQYIYYDSDNNRIKNYIEWKNKHPGEVPRKELSRIHSQTVKKWMQECEAALYDGATEQNSIGCIFALKANYGYTETAPVPTVNQNQRVLSASELPKFGEIREIEERNKGLIEHNT